MLWQIDFISFFSRLLTALALAVGLNLAAPLVALGQAPEAADEASGWQFGIAVGAGRQLNPFVDSDDIDIPVVLDIAWYGERFFFDNGDFGYSLLSSERFSLNAVATLVNERNYYSYLRNAGSGLNFFGSLHGGEAGLDAEGGSLRNGPEGSLAEDEVLDSGLRVDSRLPKRDFALHGGLELLWLTPLGDWQAQLSSNFSGTHGGQEVWLAHTLPWFRSRQRFALSWGLEWKSADLAAYYYGVEPDEAHSLRPAYRPGSALNAFLRFAASHRLSERLQLVSVIERKRLDGSLRRSPVIDRGTLDSFFLGLFYRF